MNIEITNEENLDFEEYILKLEKEWYNSLSKFNNKELIDIFPEVKKIIPKKIKDFQEEKNKIINTIIEKMIAIKERNIDDFSLWFFREWIKEFEGKELLKVEKKITRLKGLLLMTTGKIPKKWITEEEIREALIVPIEIFIKTPIKKSGKYLTTHCPFHSEKTPSFYIYPKTNTCWCFGCQKGGNSIQFIREIYNYSFKEAVNYLTRR